MLSTSSAALVVPEEKSSTRSKIGRIAHVLLDLLGREQRTLGGLAAGVADHARSPAHQGDRPVSGPLEPGEEHDADQVADGEAVGRGVVADVGGPTSTVQVCRREILGGGLVEEPAPAEVFKERVYRSGTPERFLRPSDPDIGRSRDRLETGLTLPRASEPSRRCRRSSSSRSR